jgi:hypothetical protein
LQLKEETASAELRVTTAAGFHSALTVSATGCPHLSHRVQQRALPLIPSRKDWFEGNTTSCPDRSAATEREEKDSKSLDNLILNELLSNPMIGKLVKHTNAMTDTLFRVSVIIKPAWAAALAVDGYEIAQPYEMENADFFRLKDEAEFVVNYGSGNIYIDSCSLSLISQQ